MNSKISEKLIFIVFIELFLMLSHKPALADPLGSKLLAVECEITIIPSSAEATPRVTVQFSASTICNGDSLDGTYSWEIMERGSTGSTINNSGLYTAGSIVGTDTVTVTDSTHGNISASAQVVVESSIRIVVSPDSILRSRWIILPYLMTIKGTNTNFATSNTKVSFTPAGSILGNPPLILGTESILQLIFVNSSLFLAGAEDETVTVTVMTGTEVATDDVTIELLSFPLDKQKQHIESKNKSDTKEPDTKT